MPPLIFFSIGLTFFVIQNFPYLDFPHMSYSLALPRN
jgi:hypothetical protein